MPPTTCMMYMSTQMYVHTCIETQRGTCVCVCMCVCVCVCVCVCQCGMCESDMLPDWSSFPHLCSLSSGVMEKRQVHCSISPLFPVTCSMNTWWSQASWCFSNWCEAQTTADTIACVTCAWCTHDMQWTPELRTCRVCDMYYGCLDVSIATSWLRCHLACSSVAWQHDGQWTQQHDAMCDMHCIALSTMCS